MALEEGSVVVVAAVSVVVEDMVRLSLTALRCQAMGCRLPTCIPRPFRTGADTPLRDILPVLLVSLPCVSRSHRLTS